MNEEKVKLQKGDKVIERNKVDYEKNKKVWEFRGYSLAQDKPKLSLVTKKKKKDD
jgi:ribosomal protein L19